MRKPEQNYGKTYLDQTSEETGGDMNSAGLVLDIDVAHKLHCS